MSPPRRSTSRSRRRCSRSWGTRSATDAALLLITHDLGVVAGNADRVVVMYAGQVVESAAVRDVFARPLHPYTAGLLASLPRLGRRSERLAVIPGGVPDPLRFPTGCRFHPRCPLAVDRCRSEAPPLVAFEGERQSRCWRGGEIAVGTVAAWPAAAESPGAGS